jgi:hypothetical protein
MSSRLVRAASCASLSSSACCGGTWRAVRVEEQQYRGELLADLVVQLARDP